MAPRFGLIKVIKLYRPVGFGLWVRHHADEMNAQAQEVGAAWRDKRQATIKDITR